MAVHPSSLLLVCVTFFGPSRCHHSQRDIINVDRYELESRRQKVGLVVFLRGGYKGILRYILVPIWFLNFTMVKLSYFLSGYSCRLLLFNLPLPGCDYQLAAWAQFVPRGHRSHHCRVSRGEREGEGKKCRQTITYTSALARPLSSPAEGKLLFTLLNPSTRSILQASTLPLCTNLTWNIRIRYTGETYLTSTRKLN